MKLLTRRWIPFAALLLAVIAGGYMLVPVQESRISRANCDRIQVGWSVEQVQELLGESAIIGDSIHAGKLGKIEFETIIFWADADGNLIEVIFSDRWQIVSKRYVASDLSFLERVKRRIMGRLKSLWP